MFKIACVCCLLMSALLPTQGQTKLSPARRAPLVVGWHDEMNDPGLWKPMTLENQPDIYAERPGVVTLRLPHVPNGYPYQYQWSGVTRNLTADLARYPVLIANVSELDADSYAHLDIVEYDFNGQEAGRWRSPTLTHPGLSVVDLGKEIGPSVRRLTIRLIVGGKLEGAKCSYNWLRFVRRADVAYLQEVPDLQNILSREPTTGHNSRPVCP